MLPEPARKGTGSIPLGGLPLWLGMGRGTGAGRDDANGAENRLGTALGWEVQARGLSTAAVAPGSVRVHAGACSWAPTSGGAQSGQVNDEALIG